MDEENKEYYIQEALKSITDLVRVNFNKIKTILDNADNYEKEEEDGFYFPKILVQALRDVDEQYHLNPYMDLSISDILNQIDDSDTIEDTVKEFFDDYAPEDAYSWAMNLIDTLSNEDLNVNSQYTVWKVYDVISENDLLNQNYNNSQFEGEEELKGFETEDEAMQYANDKYNELLKTEDKYNYNKGERAYSVLVLVVYDLDGDLINDISISWDDLYDEVVNGEKRKLEAEKEKLVNELTAEADKTYKEIKDIMIKEGSEEAFNNIKERVDRLDLRHIDKVDIKDIVDTIDYEDSAKEVVKELATNWDWDYNLDDLSEHRALDEVVKLFNNGDAVKEEGREIKKESKKDSTIEYVIAYNEGEDIFDTKEEADEKFEELEKAGKLKDVDEYYSKEWIWDDDINDYVEGNVEVFYYGDTIKEESISNNKEEHREILNEDTEEAEIINPDDEEYYNNLYRVTIGKGIGGVTFIVYANNEEEALEIAVAECEIKGYDGLISTIYEIKREVEKNYEEEYKEYIEKNPEAILEDFIEDYLHYIYVDATEYGASGSYYVEGDYISIEEEKNIEGNKKEEAKRLPNISKFIYDIDNDKGNAWSVTDYTQDNNGNKLIVVSRNGNSKNSIDDIIEAVEKNYPQLEGQKMGRFDNKIWFYLKSDNKLDESKKEGAKATFKDKVRTIKKSLKDRDKRISDENAEEQAKKIAGSIVKKEKEKKQEDKSNIVTMDELKDKIYELGYKILDDDRDYTGHSIVVYKNNEVNNFEDNDNEALYTYLDSIPNIRYTIDDEDPSTLAIYLLDIEQEDESIDSKLYKEQELMNIVKDTMNKLPDAKQLQDFLSKCEENNILSLKVGDYFINWDYTVEDSTDPSWIGINVEGKGVPVAISCRKGTKSEQVIFGLKNGSLDYRSLYLGDEDKERYVLLYPIIESNYSYICNTYDIDNIINCCKVLKYNIDTYMNNSKSSKDESKEVIKLEGRKAVIIEDTNIGNTEDTNKTKFDVMKFEKQLPENMSWKVYDIVEGNNLYWVTQAPFNEEDLKKFAKVFKETPFYKAYVTTRDYSVYDFKKDKERNVFATVDKEDNIDIANYLQVQGEDEKAYQEFLASINQKA